MSVQRRGHRIGNAGTWFVSPEAHIRVSTGLRWIVQLALEDEYLGSIVAKRFFEGSQFVGRSHVGRFIPSALHHVLRPPERVLMHDPSLIDRRGN